MKNKILSLVLAIALMPLSCMGAVNPVVAKAHRTTHVITQSTILEGDKCSATAIGPAALLTASHCEMPTDKMSVDGQPVLIADRIRDGNDHTIYIIKGMKFDNYAEIGDSYKEVAGSDVFIFGNPGDFDDLYRKGVVSGRKGSDALAAMFGIKTPNWIVYDMNGFFGDSGSGIFDAETGKIVGVNSVCFKQGDSGYSQQLMGGLDFAFTPAQIAKAIAAQPTEAPKVAPERMKSLFEILGRR